MPACRKEDQMREQNLEQLSRRDEDVAGNSQSVKLLSLNSLYPDGPSWNSELQRCLAFNSRAVRDVYSQAMILDVFCWLEYLFQVAFGSHRQK